MEDNPSPAVQRRRLRAELRRIRLDQAKETQEHVAAEMDWSLSKLIRIENGSVGISTNDLKMLLGHYGVADERIEELVALAKAARERSWWSAYSKVAPPRLLQFIEYEAAAKITRNFQPLLIPGLLQTEEYARVVITEFSGQDRKDHVDDLVALRMKRQELLKQTEPPPWFFFILNEDVVRRLVGGKDVMLGQIQYLIELASRDNLTIEIVPFSAGVHRGMQGPFVVLEFPEEDDDVLYLESPRGDLINRDDPEEIVAYREIFEALRDLSLGAGSVDFLRGLLDEYR